MWEESGLKFGYTNWSPRQPDNHPHNTSGEDCLEFIFGNTKQWNDSPCTWKTNIPICQLKGNLTSTNDFFF